MMDCIYSGVPPTGTSAIGQGLFGATTRVSMGLSVLYRRQLLKSVIDDTVVTQDAGRLGWARLRAPAGGAAARPQQG